MWRLWERELSFREMRLYFMQRILIRIHSSRTLNWARFRVTPSSTPQGRRTNRPYPPTATASHASVNVRTLARQTRPNHDTPRSNAACLHHPGPLPDLPRYIPCPRFERRLLHGDEPAQVGCFIRFYSE